MENQVGNVREWLFTPLARFASFAGLNDLLATRCHELAQRCYFKSVDKSGGVQYDETSS